MKGHFITYPAKDGKAEAYVVEARLPKACVIVIHEVWGLSPRIKQVCKQVSKLGFTAIAPNLYWRNKRLFTPDMIRLAMKSVWHLSLEERYDQRRVRRELKKQNSPKEVYEILATLYDPSFRETLLHDMISCAKYGRSKYHKVGALGFSMGGGLCLRLAANFRFQGCVTFYAEPPSPSEIKRIEAPILAIFAGYDEITNPKIPRLVNNATRYRKPLTLKVYPEAKHGFFNNKEKTIADREATKDSWDFVASFLTQTLTITH